MKQEIEIRPDSIRDILLIANNIVPKKTLLPILDNICLIIKNGVLTVRAGSLETQVTMKVELNGVEDDFSAAVPAATFCNVLNSLQVDKLKIIKDDNKVMIKSGKNKYSMPVYNVDEYPILHLVNPSEPIRIDGEVLSRYIKKASMLTNPSDVRPAMCSINLEVVGSEFFVMGTDAHQGGVLSIPSTGSIESTLISRDAGGIMQLIKFNGPTTISKGKDSIEIVCGSTSIVSRVVEAKYVPLLAQFKNKKEGFVTVSKTDMTEAMGRIKLFTNIESHRVDLTVEGNEITIKAFNENTGKEAQEVINCTNNGVVDISLGFNIQFLFNMFNLIDSVEVNMHITEINRPIYFNASGDNVREFYLSLPMV